MLLIRLDNKDNRKDISNRVKKIAEDIARGYIEGELIHPRTMKTDRNWYLTNHEDCQPSYRHLAIYFAPGDSDATRAKYVKEIAEIINDGIYAGGDRKSRHWILNLEKPMGKNTKTEKPSASRYHFVEGERTVLESAGIEIQRFVISGEVETTDFLVIRYPEELSDKEITELQEVVARSTPVSMGTLLFPKNFDSIEMSTEELRAYRDKINTLLSIREQMEHPKGWERKLPV